ncbi:MAG: hypothetical protein IKW45_03710 [Clostridia bacterium]|nr:hypothetical protein [Clostridia bacterium]
MRKTIYKDRKGERIAYGDILRCISIEKNCDFESPYSTKIPFFMLCKLDGKTMMYTSAGDEYIEIDECKLKTDKIDELNGFEIFAKREIYELVNEVNKQ